VEIIRERVLAGMAYAKEFGTKSKNPIGRPRKVFSHDKARALAAQGLNERQIAEKLGGVSRSTVRRALRKAAA
jgi:DNA invertase Pin-like site-specific DNA recombinase